MKVIVIGGVAGGAAAAARIRRLDEYADIRIYERTGYMSYANCGLPYFIGDVIIDRSKLTLMTPESFGNRFHVEVKVKHQVEKILRDKKTVIVKNLETGKIFEDHYDKLVLSPGAAPSGMNIKGAVLDRVFTLRTVEDTFRLYDFIGKTIPKNVVVVGGGFIGIEIAENLTRKGIAVKLVEFMHQVMMPFDYDMACQIQTEMVRNGVQLYLETGVKEFVETENGGIKVITTNNEINTDFVVMAIGVRAETALAVDAGLAIGTKGIKVNDLMQTSDPDIYAVGDAVETFSWLTKKEGVMALAGPASKQARIAADNICGGNSHYKGYLGTSVLKVFDMTAAVTGLNEKAAKEEGIDYYCGVTINGSHATYYPNSKSIISKVLFDKHTGKIIGAQLTGYDGVDKRIDVYAATIKAGMTAYDLAELDLAYAPPFSSAKDPVNMMGFLIENLLEGKVQQIYWYQVDELPRDGSINLIDVRTPMEYENGHIEGFINIPLDQLRDHLDELPKDKKTYINCQSALRSYIACRELCQRGYECYNISGGYGFYSSVKQGIALSQKSPESCGKSFFSFDGMTG